MEFPNSNASGKNRITVVLADDHTIVREGFRKLLELADDLQVIGEARDGREAVGLAKKLNPAVMLVDITMPVLNGLEATRQILEVSPETKVIILSAHNEDQNVTAAIEVGASGFLLKHASTQEVCRAIREVPQQDSFCVFPRSRRVDRLISCLNPSAKSPGKRTPLTSREREVLQLIAEGQPNKAIAQELGISSKTVEKHRANLMEKLDIHDTAGLTRYAIASGISATRKDWI